MELIIVESRMVVMLITKDKTYSTRFERINSIA
jgi:hypothetical protein